MRPDEAKQVLEYAALTVGTIAANGTYTIEEVKRIRASLFRVVIEFLDPLAGIEGPPARHYVGGRDGRRGRA